MTTAANAHLGLAVMALNNARSVGNPRQEENAKCRIHRLLDRHRAALDLAVVNVAREAMGWELEEQTWWRVKRQGYGSPEPIEGVIAFDPEVLEIVACDGDRQQIKRSSPYAVYFPTLPMAERFLEQKCPQCGDLGYTIESDEHHGHGVRIPCGCDRQVVYTGEMKTVNVELKPSPLSGSPTDPLEPGCVLVPPAPAPHWPMVWTFIAGFAAGAVSLAAIWVLSL